MPMVRLQSSKTPQVMSGREEQGEGSMLEEGDGAGKAGRMSRSGFHCTACGSGGARGSEVAVG